MISPVYEALSEEHTEAVFLKVCPSPSRIRALDLYRLLSILHCVSQIDVDEQPALAQAAMVTAMPTFQFLKGGAKVQEVVGAGKNYAAYICI